MTLQGHDVIKVLVVDYVVAPDRVLLESLKGRKSLNSLGLAVAA
jgi:hypothetical protein